jgi:hypothetical protein
MDVLYARQPYDLPISLEIGDKVLIEGTGAYKTTYASVAFNGFAPLIRDQGSIRGVRRWCSPMPNSVGPCSPPEPGFPPDPRPLPTISGTAMVTIRHERPTDIAAREALLDLCFGGARLAKSSERLREGRLPAEGLSLVTSERCHLVGTVRLWHVSAGPGRNVMSCVATF